MKNKNQNSNAFDKFALGIVNAASLCGMILPTVTFDTTARNSLYDIYQETRNNRSKETQMLNYSASQMLSLFDEVDL